MQICTGDILQTLCRREVNRSEPNFWNMSLEMQVVEGGHIGIYHCQCGSLLNWQTMATMPKTNNNDNQLILMTRTNGTFIDVTMGCQKIDLVFYYWVYPI